MPEHTTVTRAEWDAARAELLKREKELTRMSDELARQRRELPWVPVEKQYTFQTADGPKTLSVPPSPTASTAWSSTSRHATRP
jgi:predicted dithiol-disulfide oxidoreductase (DUF899 family)